MTRRIFRAFLLLFALCATGAAYGQAPEVCENKLPKDPAYYADMKEMPRGKSGFSYTFDKARVDDSSTPVVVLGLGGISSAKQRAGKLSCAEIENRTARVVKSVQLRWVVTALGPGRSAVENAEALAKGLLPAVEVEVAPGGRRKVELRGAHFADFLQPLAVNGEVNGEHNVSVSVARVEFTDGTSLDLP